MKLSGWGCYPIIECAAHLFEKRSTAAALLSAGDDWIAYGQGKSYGDSALAPHVLLTQEYNKLIDFDAQTGVVTCECGITLAELIDLFLPRGWFLKVTPGTKLISVGGAIASDVHGKNHHAEGCFSESVISLRLMLPDGTIASCSREENVPLFRATCGGMGLTGVILDATLQLKAVNSAYIRENIIPCANLDEVFVQYDRCSHYPYSVAWIDCLAGGSSLGRSILMVGDHDDDGELTLPEAKRLSVPVTCPSFLLNNYTLSMFNQIYYRVKGKPAQRQRVPLETFFYPLDKIDHWNRMYGKAGFVQYQCVLPMATSYKGMKALLQQISAAGMGSFLAVIKLFGPQNENFLSFPMEGYTLALDFKIQPKLFGLLERLDRIVLEHDGRLYLTKDSRMSEAMFMQGYPRWREFQDLRTQYGMKKKFNSWQSKRIGL
ncbi:MAG: FAD-binding oxidoreductase [Desulfobacteraceae bacterium]|nr:FAD-binding oxidoreductase [Desulfobacteraceae bacterium]